MRGALVFFSLNRLIGVGRRWMKPRRNPTGARRRPMHGFHDGRPGRRVGFRSLIQPMFPWWSYGRSGRRRTPSPNSLYPTYGESRSQLNRAGLLTPPSSFHRSSAIAYRSFIPDWVDNVDGVDGVDGWTMWTVIHPIIQPSNHPTTGPSHHARKAKGLSLMKQQVAVDVLF